MEKGISADTEKTLVGIAVCEVSNADIDLSYERFVSFGIFEEFFP